MLPSEVPRLTTDSPVRVFPGVWKLLSFLRLPSRDGSPSLPLLSLFLSFIFFPTSWYSKDNGLLFWVPDVLCQHSEVVLWNLLSIKCSFDEFVGEKVVPLSYSSTILGPSPCNNFVLYNRNCGLCAIETTFYFLMRSVQLWYSRWLNS